jgi:hypothetical protein
LSDSHLHRFHIHGRDYGIGKIGGIGFSTDAKRVRLADFRFRINERFRYEYDFGDAWQHEVRIEQRLPLDGTCVYPRCIGGRRQAPPEDCGGPLAFMAQRDRLSIQVDELFWQLQEDMRVLSAEASRATVSRCGARRVPRSSTLMPPALSPARSASVS